MNFHELGKTWIAAEIGVNHEGDKAVAADLIRLAADTGVDAVKFQTYKIENYVSTVQQERRERAGRFQLSYDDFRGLAKLAGDCGVTFFSTPLHPDDVDFLDSIVPFFKISSGDITYLPLIRHIASKNKPIILSTGLGTPQEIRTAVDSVMEVRPDIGKKGEFMLMHCVAAYPPEDREANLRNILWLKEEFGLPVGYSDHTIGTKACELAVAVGAVALEKHFTYRKENQAFHDHHISADPNDMKELVDVVRRAEVYLGVAERRRSESEQKLLQHMRRSLAAACGIPAGTRIKADWLTYLRPAWGLGPEAFDEVVGKTLKRTVAAGDLIRAEDVDQ